MMPRLRDDTGHSATISCPAAGCGTVRLLADSTGIPGMGIWSCDTHGEFGPGARRACPHWAEMPKDGCWYCQQSKLQGALDFYGDAAVEDVAGL